MHKVRFITLLFFGSTAIAQQTHEKQAVHQVIRNMFIAMQTGDTALFRSCFAPKVIFQTIVTKENQTQVKSEDFEAFIKNLTKYPKGALDERIKFKGVHQDGTLASVWTPYQFYYQGKFSHGGVNSFQLVKLGNAWKIQYLIDTRRK
ncbi:nuclear transport factor 2 family protein [Aquirufa regiilacus]